MSNYSRAIRKKITKDSSDEEKRVLAVSEWADTYLHNYPNFQALSKEPVETLLGLMKDHDISVKMAAQVAEKFALEFLNNRELPETD